MTLNDLRSDGPPLRVRDDVVPPWVDPKAEPLPLLNWPAEIASRLRRNGIETWPQLLGITEERFLGWPGCGRRTLAELRNLILIARREIRVIAASTTDVQLPMMVAPIVVSPPSKSSRSGVYFVRSTPFIKIGISAHVVRRLESMRTGNPHELIGLGWILAVDEAETLEAALHRQFHALRHRGEWFHEHPDIFDYIRTKALPWPEAA